jgi:hypothetical protein
MGTTSAQAEVAGDAWPTSSLALSREGSGRVPAKSLSATEVATRVLATSPAERRVPGGEPRWRTTSVRPWSLIAATPVATHPMCPRRPICSPPWTQPTPPHESLLAGPAPTVLRAWSGLTGWRFESSSAHLTKAPLGGAFCVLGVSPDRAGSRRADVDASALHRGARRRARARDGESVDLQLSRSDRRGPRPHPGDLKP